MKRLDQSGVTLIELLITLGMTAMIAMSIIMFMFTYWRYGFRLQSDEDTLITRLNANDILRETLGSSSGLISQNSITDAHASKIDPIEGAGYWLTEHAVPGNIPVPAAGQTTPVLYFKKFTTNSSGGYIMNGSQVYEDEFVLYLDGSTSQLRLRNIANPNATGNRTKTSCPPAIATNSCPADRTVANSLASVDTRFFSRTGAGINYTSVVDPYTNEYIGPDFPTVEVVELTLHIYAKPGLSAGYRTQSTNIVRIALRNN